MNRTLKINLPMFNSEQQYFTDIETHKSIQCAFDKDKKCGPDCAACDASITTRKYICLRGDFLIGLIEPDELALELMKLK